MLISHHPASAECLQLGEGMLLCGFDLDKALSSRDPLDCMAEAVADDTKRIGTTCGGGIFRAVPREFDPESGSHRLPFAGSIRLIDWRVTLSGTMLDVTPENLARLLPSGTEMTERVTTLTPKQTRKPLSRLCWIGTTSRGLLLIELRNPLCISGASLTSVPDGAGRLPFTFLAQNDRPGDVNLPARLYWWKEETHDAA